jgi:hypothetical protein
MRLMRLGDRCFLKTCFLEWCFTGNFPAGVSTQPLSIVAVGFKTERGGYLHFSTGMRVLDSPHLIHQERTYQICLLMAVFDPTETFGIEQSDYLATLDPGQPENQNGYIGYCFLPSNGSKHA